MERSSELITSHQSYIKRRIWLSAGLSILTFCLSLGANTLLVHYNLSKAQSQYSQQVFANFSQEMSEAAELGSTLLPLLQQSCSNVKDQLQQTGAISSTLRSIMLIDNEKVYCSSTLGAHRHNASYLFPDITQSISQLQLLSGSFDLGTRPLMALWLPQAKNPYKGVMLLIDLQQLIRFQLQVSHPYLTHAALQIEKLAIVGGNNKIIPQPSLTSSGYTHSTQLLNTHIKIHIYARPLLDILFDNAASHVAVALLLALIIGSLTFRLSQKHLSIQHDLLSAMQRNEFIIKYQPIIQTDTLRCIGAEILVRWQSPKRMIPPDVFIPLIEEIGLIIPFTRYLMSRISDEIRNTLPLPNNFKLSINIDAEHLHDTQLLTDMLRLKHAIRADLQLVVELTERTPIDIDAHTGQLQQLQQHAIQIALDDFGCGHSSLSYLKKLHPNYIKIDKTFTAAIGTEAITATVLDMIINLGQRLNIAIVAEGVETEAQLNYLLDHGVHFLQGFYFSRPISITELHIWLNSRITSLPSSSASKQSTHQAETENQ